MPVFREGDLSICLFFVMVIFQQTCLSSEWSFSMLVFCKSEILVCLSFVKVIFRQAGLSSRSSFSMPVFVKLIFQYACLSSRWSFSMLVFRQGDLSAGWFFVKGSIVFFKPISLVPLHVCVSMSASMKGLHILTELMIELVIRSWIMQSTQGENTRSALINGVIIWRLLHSTAPTVVCKLRQDEFSVWHWIFHSFTEFLTLLFRFVLFSSSANDVGCHEC